MDVVKHPIQTAMQQWKSRRRGHFAVVCGLVRIPVSARGICLIVSYTPVEQVTNQLLCKDAHFLPLQCYCIDLTCDPKEATNTLSRLSTTNTLSRLSTTNTLSRLSTTDTLPHLIITTIVSYSHRLHETTPESAFSTERDTTRNNDTSISPPHVLRQQLPGQGYDSIFPAKVTTTASWPRRATHTASPRKSAI